jgi:hypothetical protein
MRGEGELVTGIPGRLSSAEGRKFGVTVGAAFLVLAGITWWREHETLMYVFTGLGGALLVAGLVIPGQLGPVHRAWMGLAHALSKVTTPIFMGIVYFLVIMPSGLIMRALGRNPIRHQAVNGSFWAAHGEGRGSMTNQF